VSSTAGSSRSPTGGQIGVPVLENLQNKLCRAPSFLTEPVKNCVARIRLVAGLLYRYVIDRTRFSTANCGFVMDGTRLRVAGLPHSRSSWASGHRTVSRQITPLFGLMDCLIIGRTGLGAAGLLASHYEIVSVWKHSCTHPRHVHQHPEPSFCTSCRARTAAAVQTWESGSLYVGAGQLGSNVWPGLV